MRPPSADRRPPTIRDDSGTPALGTVEAGTRMAVDPSTTLGQHPGAGSPAAVGGRRAAVEQPVAAALFDGQQFAVVGVFLLLLVLVGAPVLTIIWMSLGRNLPGQARSLSMQNYASVLSDPFLLEVVGNTVAFAGVTLAVTFLFLVPLTFLLTRTDLPFRWGFVVLLSVVILVPTFLRAIGWILLLSPQIGLINKGFQALFGLAQPPFTIYSMLGMAFVQGISFVPAGFFMLSAAYRAMDPSLEEAAYTSGLGKLRTFLRVNLPLTLPALLGVFIYLFMTAISVFEAPAIIGLPARIFVLSSVIYLRVHPQTGLPDYAVAGAYGSVMLILGIALSVLYFQAVKQSRRFVVVSGKGYRPKTIKLGRWKPAAVAFVVFFFLVESGIPLAMLIWTSLTPYLMVPSVEALGQLSLANYSNVFARAGARMVWNTVILVALAPLMAVALSIMVGWIVTRTRSRLRAAVDALAFLPHAVPHILFAVALSYLALLFRQQVPLYGSIFLIVLAHGIAYLSFGSRAINSAMIQIHRELEEAGRLSGLSALGTLRRIVVPLVTAAVFSSWFWIALLSYREVTAALMLYVQSNDVLSAMIWMMWREGQTGAVAALGTVMVLVLTALMGVVGYFFRDVLTARASGVEGPVGR
jgi:iron(III) transport system permease protein